MITKKKLSSLFTGVGVSYVIGALLWSTGGHALELNWSGQFWSEAHYIKNYTLDGSGAGEIFDPARASKAVGGTLDEPGYYIPSGGSANANFETLFMRLRPQLVVNDSISLKSELWAGDPVFGLFGNAVPYTWDQHQAYSTQSRGSFLTAQRYWVELLSDFGVLHVGRAPLDWGLGIVWNSGDSLWSRYASTADVVRLVSKFGSFSFSPSIAVYSSGNNLGGACLIGPLDPADLTKGMICAPVAGQRSAGIADYSLALKYESLEDELEGGVNLIKRIAGSSQDGTSLSMGAPMSTNYNIWDLYARKKVGKFTLSGELPVVNGAVGGMAYSGYALAGDLNWKPTESWETSVRLGRAPGQPSEDTQTPSNYRAFFFNPNYRLGMILFNYQLANFIGPNTANHPSAPTLKSPFDHPITNATYVSVGQAYKTEKWTFSGGLIYAQAVETALAGRYFFNTWERKMMRNNSGRDQENSLGTELDLGAGFQWDDHISVRFDTGLWFPGGFYKFSNTAVDNVTDPVWATTAKLGVSF